jgi:hypothetical protein
MEGGCVMRVTWEEEDIVGGRRVILPACKVEFVLTWHGQGIEATNVWGTTDLSDGMFQQAGSKHQLAQKLNSMGVIPVEIAKK